MTVALERSERASTLARRIVKRYGDEELSNDLLDLLILVSDPAGNASRADAAREAMKQVIANSGVIEDVLDQRCRRVDTSSGNVNDDVDGLAAPQSSAEPYQAGAEVPSGQQAVVG